MLLAIKQRTMSSDSESSKMEESKPGDSARAVTTAATELDAVTETDLPASEELTTLDDSLERKHEAPCQNAGSLREGPGTSASSKDDKLDELGNIVTPCSHPAQSNNDIERPEKHESEMVDTVKESDGSILYVAKAKAHKIRPSLSSGGGRGWKTEVEGTFNAYGSEGPAAMIAPCGTVTLPAGSLITLRQQSGGAPDPDRFGLPATYEVTDRTDLSVVALAFAGVARRTLGVPDDCFTFVWDKPVPRPAEEGSLIDVLLVVQAFSDDLAEEMSDPLDDECCICHSPCEDADEPASSASRDANCARCHPCYLCGRCRLELEDGTACCLDCMEQKDVAVVREHGTPTEVYRRTVLVPQINWSV